MKSLSCGFSSSSKSVFLVSFFTDSAAISTPSIVALNRGKIHEMADPSEMSFKLLNKLINVLKSK